MRTFAYARTMLFPELLQYSQSESFTAVAESMMEYNHISCSEVIFSPGLFSTSCSIAWIKTWNPDIIELT
jgi:hypothetical protein